MSGTNPFDKKQLEAMIAERKAAVMRKFANMAQGKSAALGASTTATAATATTTASLVAAMGSATANKPQFQNNDTIQTPAAGKGVFSNNVNLDLIQAQIAAANAQAQIRLKNYMASKHSGTLPNTAFAASNPSSEQRNQATLAQSKGGLNSELHPMLKRNLNDPSPVGNSNKKSRKLALLPRFSTVKANQARTSQGEFTSTKDSSTQRQAQFSAKSKSKNNGLRKSEATNPYLSHIYNNKKSNSGISGNGSIDVEDAPKERRRRAFNFAKHGTYIKMAEKMRSEAKLEEMKQKIAEQMKKAGLELEIKEAEATVLVQKPPPEVEWWDAPLLSQPKYSDIFSLVNSIGVSREIKTAPITHYIQHPVPIQPPVDTTKVVVSKNLMLTKKEHKKLRRQRRQEELKDIREKIQMGLLPPEQPKLKLSNLMNVMGTQFIQDPTKMEALARTQMQQRQAAHLKANNERKLTKEEKKAKASEKDKIDLSKGVYLCVYKIGNLDNPKLRYKVNINAQQLNLTGVLLIYSGFCLAVVEGGMRATRAYKKLMLRRMNWKEPTLTLLTNSTDNGSTNNSLDSKRSTASSSGEAGILLRSSENSCSLVWEGQVVEKRFKAFRVRVCPTENTAKEWLVRAGVESYWDAAKSHSLPTQSDGYGYEQGSSSGTIY